MLGQFENVGAFQRECNGTTLRYDQACLQILTNETITFWSQYAECEDCMLLKTAELSTSGDIILDTISPLRYAIKNQNGEICYGSYAFDEFGRYSINVSDITRDLCQPRMTAEPDAALLPILTAVVVLLSMATLWYIVKGIGKRVVAGRWYATYFARSKLRASLINTSASSTVTSVSPSTEVSPVNLTSGSSKNVASDSLPTFDSSTDIIEEPIEDNELGSETRVLTTEASVPRSPKRSRLRSLDIFRGFCIALMIFVNYGGGGYAIFSHSVWNGLTVADVVFPWFAFAMGEALVLSLNARLRTSLPRLSALGQVARRSLVLSLIGICLSSVKVSWMDVRLPGVLQRLAAMYFIVGALECAFMRTSQNITPGRSLFRDIAAGWQQWLATILLVAIHVCITLTVAAPGCPRGYLGPGGLHRTALGDFSLQNCTGGIAGYIDRLLLGPSHLYQRGTFRKIYHTTEPYDPEGILGILSGVLLVQAGAHASRIMLVYNHARARIMRWVFWSIIFGVTGGALCLFSKNGGPIPINKNLWSVSYCLVTASMAFFIQAALYFVVDLKTKWGGRPLYYAGQNALILYIGSELLKSHFPFHWHIPAPTHSQLLATHAAAMLMWLAVGVALYKKRVFITL